MTRIHSEPPDDGEPATPASVRQSLSRQERLRRPRDFDRVFQGSYAADSVLVIHGQRNGMARSRLGVSVSKRVGGAVERNRWKRRIREAFRRQKHRLPIDLDIVVRPRRGAELDTEAIFASMVRLLSRLSRSLRRSGGRPT